MSFFQYGTIYRNLLEHHNESTIKLVHSYIEKPSLQNNELLDSNTTTGYCQNIAGFEAKNIKCIEDILSFFRRQGFIKIALYSNTGDEIAVYNDSMEYNNYTFIGSLRKIFNISSTTQSDYLLKALNGSAVSYIEDSNYIYQNEIYHNLITTFVPIFYSNSNTVNPIEVVIALTSNSQNFFKGLNRLKIQNIFTVTLVGIITLMLFTLIVRNTKKILYKEVDTFSLYAANNQQHINNLQHQKQTLSKMNAELQSQIDVILGFSQLLCNKLSKPNVNNDEMKNYADNILTTAQNSVIWIDNMQDLLLLSLQQFHLKKQSIDLTQIMRNSVNLAQQKAKDKNVSLIIQILERKVFIKADARKLQQIVIYLIDNAIKFTDANGSVKISTQLIADNKSIVLNICDSGLGIRQEDLARILMERSDHTIDNKYIKGLKLNLSYQLIQWMQGTFEIHSRPHEGTNITISFKVVELGP